MQHQCALLNTLRFLTPLVFLQGTAGPDPTTVYVDMRALRHDRYVCVRVRACFFICMFLYLSILEILKHAPI